MQKPYSFGEIHLDVNPGRQRGPQRPEPNTPFRILVLGDFSGRANRGLFDPELAGRRPVRVDRDDFDQVLEKLQPELCLPRGMSLRFRELDDFHPDRIFERSPVFQALGRARARLSDRATFAAAAASLRPPAPSFPSPAPAPPANLRGLFEQSLEATEARTEHRPARAVDDFSALVREIVRPHLVPGEDPRQAELIGKVDMAIAEQMRACLHEPAFQALEAAWRALFFLVRRVETGAELQLYLLDLSREELAAGSHALYRLIVEDSVGTPGGQPWAVLAGNFAFDGTQADAELLRRMARIGHAAGAPFLAEATPRVPADTRAWAGLRQLSEARWIGLALPRFLLRLPYGKETDAVEQFAFEEFAGPPVHDDYLWGNPALACACLLGQAFSRSGWGLRPGEALDLENLPAHVYRDDGESQLKPCAEVLMTLEDAEEILDTGLMPLLSMKGRDCVRLARFQSLADPPAPLAGRWGVA